MTSRERVPAVTYHKLWKHPGLPEKAVRVFDTVKQLAIVVLILLCSCSGKQDQATLVISNEELNPVNRQLFGHFLEKCSWGGEIGGDLVINPETGTYDKLILEQLQSMAIPNLRYPGGSDVDYYNWTELIDHAPGQTERKPYREYQAGPEGTVVSDNRLGLNEFLELCEILKAEPILVLNLGQAYHKTQSIQDAKESAAAMYAYCNLPADSGNEWANYRRQNGREKPYRVKYFEIGNEYLGFEGFNWRQDYDRGEPIIHLYQCIKALVDTLYAMDPEVKLIVDGPIPELNQLLETGLKEKISYLVSHTYVPWGIGSITVGESGAADLSSMSPEQIWNAWVATPAIDSSSGLAVLPSDPYHSAPLNTGYQVAVSEWNWNGWFEGDPRKAGLPESDLAKGVGAAGFLHAMMRRGDRLEMACQSMTVGQNWGITGIRVDPEYQQKSVILPTLLVTGLYSKYHGNSLLKTEYRNIPSYVQDLRMNSIIPREKVSTLDMLATRTENQLYIHVINRSYKEAIDLHIDLEGFTIEKTYQRHSLSGDKSAAISSKSLKQAAEIVTSGFQYRGRSLVLDVPESSVSVFVFDLK